MKSMEINLRKGGIEPLNIGDIRRILNYITIIHWLVSFAYGLVNDLVMYLRKNSNFAIDF
jgi:hypothetical protein